MCVLDVLQLLQVHMDIVELFSCYKEARIHTRLGRGLHSRNGQIGSGRSYAKCRARPGRWSDVLVVKQTSRVVAEGRDSSLMMDYVGKNWNFHLMGELQL
jgi:hypothetical protein